MGGVISRLYIQEPGYQHEVRRIITSNTPHAGSQMANLLLDRSFDPLGLICSMLSQPMSSLRTRTAAATTAPSTTCG